MGGRAYEELIGGSGECSVGAQQDIAQMTRLLRIMILRYAMGRLQELKQQAQQRNLYFLGSDVKQELNNIIDNFTTNFVDVTYNDVLSFLENIRPGTEKIVDEILLEEELSGKELRVIAKQYISYFSSGETVFNTRKSSLFTLIAPELQKTVSEIEEETSILDSQLNNFVSIN
jgi:ATP-dependent Zn protease